MVLYVARAYPGYKVNEVQDLLTLRQIQLMYYVAREDERVRLIAESREIAKALGVPTG